MSTWYREEVDSEGRVRLVKLGDILSMSPDEMRELDRYARDRWKMREYVGDLCVSTVFLGLDHSLVDGERPILYETMVFPRLGCKERENPQAPLKPSPFGGLPACAECGQWLHRDKDGRLHHAELDYAERYMARYRTRKGAIRGHFALVAKLRKGDRSMLNTREQEETNGGGQDAG